MSLGVSASLRRDMASSALENAVPLNVSASRPTQTVASGGLVPRPGVNAVVGRLLAGLDAAAAGGVAPRVLTVASPAAARGHVLQLLQNAEQPALLPPDSLQQAGAIETTDDVRQAFERFAALQPRSLARLNAAQSAYARGALLLLVNAVRTGELTAADVPAALQLIAAAVQQHGQTDATAVTATSAPATSATPPPQRIPRQVDERLAWNNPKWFGDPALDDSLERDTVHGLLARRAWPPQSEAAVTRFLHDARLQGLAERLKRNLSADGAPASGSSEPDFTASLADYLLHLQRDEAAFQRLVSRNNLLDLPLQTRVEGRWRQLSLEANNASLLGPRQLEEIAREQRPDVKAQLAVRFMLSLNTAIDANLYRADLPQRPLFTPTVDALRELAEPLSDVLQLDPRIHARLSYLAQALDLCRAIDSEFGARQTEGAVDPAFVQSSTQLLRGQADMMLRRIDEPDRTGSSSQIAPLLDPELRALAAQYQALAETIEREATHDRNQP